MRQIFRVTKSTATLWPQLKATRTVDYVSTYCTFPSLHFSSMRLVSIIEAFIPK